MNEPRHIAVEGPPGAGKAGLGERLAENLDGELILDSSLENPFLTPLYRTSRQAALPAALFQLFQRARDLDRIRQGDLFRNVRITNFLVEKDRLFAERMLDHREYALYRQIRGTLDLAFPRPDLVIYLQAPPDVLMQRIASRRSESERGVDMRYLKRSGDVHAEFFSRYDAAPLLIVDVAEIDPVQREPDYRELLEAVRRIRRGRHFLSPAADTMIQPAAAESS